MKNIKGIFLSLVGLLIGGSSFAGQESQHKVAVGKTAFVQEEPFAISVNATGPYRAPASVELVASVTHPASSTITKVEFYNNSTLLGIVTDPPYEFTYEHVPQGTYRIETRAYDSLGNVTSATAEFEVTPSNHYNRGFGVNQRTLSSLIAIDNEQGVCFDGISDFSTLYGNESKNYPWFLRATYASVGPCNHLRYEESNQSISYEAVNNLPKIDGNGIGGQPPFVAFGSQGGGSPLYVNQDYRFGVAAGAQQLDGFGNIDLQVEVYDKESFSNGAINVPRATVAHYSLPRYDPPNPYIVLGLLSSQQWRDFTENGSVQTYSLVETNNNKLIHFETSIQYLPPTWGQNFLFPLIVTHRAANNDFYYRVSIRGLAVINGQAYPLAMGSTGTNGACNLSYTLDFETPSSWNAVYLSQPHFQGDPLPDYYQGKSVDELIHHASPVRDSLRTPLEMRLDFTKLDNSPELKKHAALDQFAQLLGNDPLVIANYVQNQIGLTDAVGYNTDGDSQDISFNSQGMTRDALATYLEGQGSPIEQCSLLIYLLRKAGIPAAYVFPEHNQTLLFDQQLSRLLRVQLRGAQTSLGQSYLPELIPANYPWVTAYIEGKWIHLFPWIKDTEISEGEDVWNFFPEGYRTGRQWLLHYLFNDPSIRGLSEHGEEDNAGALFKKYAQEQLEQMNKGLENVGIQYRNRIHDYRNWDDFPRPWQIPIVTEKNLVSNLDASQNPNRSEELQDIFDTINIQILSDRNGNGKVEVGKPLLETGPIRLVDLHDRQLLLSHQLISGSNPAKYTMTLALEPYDLNESSGATYSFIKGNAPDPGDLRAAQQISTELQTSMIASENDDLLLYKITMNNHQKANDVESKSLGQLPELFESRKMEITRPLRKGDMAVLSLNYGRVSQRMIDFEIEKYKTYQQHVVTPSELTGQMLQILGKVYYEKVSSMGEELENLLKVRTLSWKACGLSKLSPERDQVGNPVLTASGEDFNLVYPRVDMYYSKTALLGNQSPHLESGDSSLRAQELTELLLAEGSAQEHRVINELFGQKGAISTIKLLDIAQGWTPETGVAATPGKNIQLLTPLNAVKEGSKNYMASDTKGRVMAKSLSQWATLYANLWKNITDNFFGGPINGSLQGVPFDKMLNIAIVNQAPVTALGQEGTPYTGMGALIFNRDSTAALISDTKEIGNGGYGGSTTPISTSHPEQEGNLAFSAWMQKVKENQDWEQISSQLHAGEKNSSSESSSTNDSDKKKDAEQKDVSSTGSTGPINSASQPIPFSPARMTQLQKECAEKGLIGTPSYYGKLLNFVHDPVSVVTGEYYINALDLSLPGPMPLELRRTYSSQNTAENNLGVGWKLGTFHYLMLSADGNDITLPSLIYAAEPDGSVIAYRYNQAQNNWIPQPSDNPNLINANDGTLQPSHNLFNNRITKTISNNLTTYILSGSDGSTRSFVVRSFPLFNTPDITRTRPYLDTWQDPQGNSLSFAYGTNNKASNWGELDRITASNGNALHFSYDARGHITEAFGSDGRHLTYQYDNFGDLIKVILADNSTITYQYAHTTTQGKTSSTHLLVQQTKPGGRILKNIYDDQRRVRTQYTNGSTPGPTLTGTFDYNSSSVNGNISGNATVTDATGNRTDYLYAQNQITNIIDPPNNNGVRSGISRQWSNNGIFKALAQETNRQGLSTTYGYDGAGNLVSKSETGNLTGSGGNEAATTTYTYNGNNLLASITDPVGNKTLYGYSGYNLVSITQTALGKIRSTTFSYQNQAGAHGLLSSINKGGALTTFTYNTQGYLTSRIQQTGTKDPALTENITCDRRGNIIQTINNLGEKKTYAYDMMDHLTFMETFDTTGALIDWHSWYYNGNGEITWSQGARFNPVDYTTFEYDWAGRVLHKGEWKSKALPDGSGVTGADMAATSYSYDTQGNRTSMTDPNGNVTTCTYDALSNMLSCTKEGATETFSYDAGGNITSHTTFLGGTEEKSYTSRSQLASAKAANGTTTSYHYDLSGRLTQILFSNGTQENISYDDANNKRTFILQSLECSETFDNQGNLIAWTDEAGNIFQAAYDGLGRIVALQGPPGGSSSAMQKQEYHYGFNSVTTVNTKGEWTTTYVDALKRPLSTFVFNSDGSLAFKESNWYAADHQSVTTWQGNENATSITTDLQSHPIILKHTDGSCVVMTYDANGNQTSEINEEGSVTKFTYDAFNHLTSQTLPDGAIIGYGYNAVGELVTRLLPNGIKEQNDYNEAGEKIADSLIGSDGRVTMHHTYGYSAGMVTSMSDPRGLTTFISYDGLNHPVSLISSGSRVSEQNQKTIYTYDPRGLMASVAQSSGSSSTLVSRAYDAYGQLISESTSLNGTPHSAWKQSWDGAGRRVALNWTLDKTSPAAQYAFSYNALGEMTSAQNGSGTCSYGYGADGLLLSRVTPFGTTGITRDTQGRILQEQLPTGALESMSWRGDGRLASYSMADPTGALVSETRNYAYDRRGRVMQEPFTSIEHGTELATYEFDPLNVRMRQEVDGSVETAVVAQNGFSQVTRDNLPTTIAPDRLLNSYYDEAGETVNRLTPEATKGLTWDGFGRLVQVSHRNSNNHGYDWTTIYDGLGRRLQSSYSDATGSQLTSAPLLLNYYYDPEVAFLEIGHDYFGRTWNLFGPDRSGFYGGVQGIGGMETTYEEHGQVIYGILKNFFGDHLGNLNTLGLYAWGEILGGYGAMPGFSVNHDLVPQWRGHYLDWTGFYYMGNRYYDPSSGRFLSADPLGHDASLSLYDYCNGDPVNGLDPDGRCVEKARENGYLNETEYQNANYIVQMMNHPSLKLSTLLWTIGGMELAYVDGDLNDPTFLAARNQALQGVPNKNQVMSVNGILTSATEAIVNANEIARILHLGTGAVLPINNYTHDWKDFFRASYEQMGFIDLRSLCLAEIVNFNNGGNIHAYSNGSIIVANAAPYLTFSARTNLEYTGLNPQRYIGAQEFGFKKVTNARNEWDVISLLFPSNRFQKWEKTLKTENYFFDILGNHSFTNNYPALMQQ